jgi:tRNA pseudouridine13 synthase
MIPDWPRAWGEPPARARIRSCPEDFVVREELGFEPSGEGEHVFLLLEKRGLNSADLQRRVSQRSGIGQRDIGMSGLKDRNAVTSQWLSVRMAGRTEPDWQLLAEQGDVQVLAVGRHQRKLRRGVHRGNRFTLVLRELVGERAVLEARLHKLRSEGVPNYFGEQRFGRDGSTLAQARTWALRGGGRLSRSKRSLYLSALRGYLFNSLLAQRVGSGSWQRILPGDICMLQGSRSHFHCAEIDADIETRGAAGDIHPGLPLLGRGELPTAVAAQVEGLVAAGDGPLLEFLEEAGLELAWRPTRMLADDFCWQFCDDGSLQLEFSLGAGCYATALLAELVHYYQVQGV